MGTLTKLELEEEVRAGLGGRRDLNSRLGRFINLAQQRLARIHDFDEMEVISNTTLIYTGTEEDRFLQMPTIREVYSIVLLNGSSSGKLVGRPATYMDRQQPKPDYWTRSQPRDYCIWGTYIELFPVYGQNYDIRMRWTQWPLDLLIDTDVSQFMQKDDVIVELAISRANWSLGKEDVARKHEAIAKELLGDVKNIDRTKPDTNISPSASDAQVAGYSGSEPWNDPFNRGTP